MNWARFAANTWLRPREPISLVLFVTGRCNARCRHCFVDFDNRARFGSELSLEEIGKIAGTLGRSVFNIDLTGGEPFLREDLGEILSVLLARTPVRAVVITMDPAVIREGRFWPIEIKWTGQLRPKDLKQIRKYHNGVIRARVRSPHSLEGVPVEPLPLALVRLA